jgi:hypothetical protein
MSQKKEQNKSEKGGEKQRAIKNQIKKRVRRNRKVAPLAAQITVSK